QDLAQELKSFLTGLDPTQGTQLSPPAHARCALLLLRSLPPARHAALHHLRSVFDDQVSSHLLNRENPPGMIPGTFPRGGMGSEEIVQETERLLTEFLQTNPKFWAPLVSSWSIDLMGQLSSKYAGRHGVPHSSNLNELLQLWMSCKATRTLMDIYTRCLASMVGGCPDSCVDALLDTSLQHSPHFDWVVAHIGSSFPNTIINRVLSSHGPSSKDFGAHGPSSKDFGPPTKDFGGHGPSSKDFPGSGSSTDLIFPDKRAPKIASVVGILGHLSSRHSTSIKQELLRMFHESLGPTRDHHQKATVPFLLQLALMSPSLLGTISTELIDSLKPNVLNQLHQHFLTLPREDLENMLTILVHLISQTSTGAYRILQFLVNTAMPASVITQPGLSLHDGVRDACDRIIQLLLLNLQQLVYHRPTSHFSETFSRPVPFLDSLRSHLRELCVETLRLERKRCLWQHQLLSLLALYSAPHCATDALFYLLTLAKTPEELTLATQLYAVLSSSLVDLLPSTVKTCVAQIHAGSLPEPQISQLCHNLAAILEWEGPEGSATIMAVQLTTILPRYLHDFAQLLLHPNSGVAEAACLLLSVCPFPRAVPPAHLFSLIRAAVHQFFWLLRHPDATNLCHSDRLVTRLSAVSPAAGKTVVQQLVEGALRPGNAQLFGATVEKHLHEDVVGLDGSTGNTGNTGNSGNNVSLLDINRRFTANVHFSGGVWSVFHAGVIGKGLKPTWTREEPTWEHSTRNIHLFLALLLRCCRRHHPGDHDPSPYPLTDVHPEAAKAVAAALVENLCPEASGGELMWPPEDQSRGTVERDLKICRRFRDHPLLFPILRLIAAGRPALCYCSVLLRGLLGSLMAFWDSCRDLKTVAWPWHLQASCWLVSCMAEGSLVPPVLGNMQEIFPHLAPFEVHLLLLSLWDYLRENHPLPQKFTFR
ncbi:Integrator complex subunit 5, partial [Antrostomus carolinensis]